ncbi:hypothetical protein M0804_013968 [Polistes exclamans]|nr:hypothetical protein M0804_013968 [Polistes exclamans]
MAETMQHLVKTVGEIQAFLRDKTYAKVASGPPVCDPPLVRLLVWCKQSARIRLLHQRRGSRPQKTSSVRLVGLESGAMSTSIRCALLEVKQSVDPNSIRLGDIRMGRGRLGEVTVTAPTAMCLAALEKRRIIVNWTSVRVLALRLRSLRCHRCLARGHVTASCPAAAARTGVCFVCGEPRHIARECAGKSRCPICAEASRPQTGRTAGS